MAQQATSCAVQAWGPESESSNLWWKDRKRELTPQSGPEASANMVTQVALHSLPHNDNKQELKKNGLNNCSGGVQRTGQRRDRPTGVYHIAKNFAQNFEIDSAYFSPVHVTRLLSGFLTGSGTTGTTTCFSV